MHYVYILKSTKFLSKYYIGYTINLEKRLKAHNARKSTYSKLYAPWDIEVYITFESRAKAIKFERYLKRVLVMPFFGNTLWGDRGYDYHTEYYSFIRY